MRKLKYKPRHEYILVEQSPERSHYVCHPPAGGWVMFLSPNALYEFFEPVEERVEVDVFRERVDEFLDWFQRPPEVPYSEVRDKLRELGLIEAGGQGDVAHPDTDPSSSSED